MKFLCETENGHKIVVSRALSYADLTVDNELCHLRSGFLATQMKSFELNGRAKNPDGSSDPVQVKVKIGFPTDTVTVSYAGKEVQKVQTYW